MLVLVLFSLCIFSATVFAEPAVTQVEEVSRLVHWTFGLCALIFVLSPYSKQPEIQIEQRTKHKAQRTLA
jgi:hypothetical protein